MKTILITGSSGFIGGSLVERLLEIKNINIIATYNKKKPNLKFKNKKIKFIKIDLNIKKSFNQLPDKIDIIYHTAAIRDSFLSNMRANRQIFENFNITQNLIDFSIKIKCKYFIYLSSVYIYSGSPKKKFIENQVSTPIESLGLSKYICETILKKTSYDYNFKCFSFRLFTAYGSNSSQNQLIPSVLKKIYSKQDTIKFGNPFIKRDFIYIDDVLDVLIDSINKIKKIDNFESFNLGSGESLSVKTAIKKIIKISNMKKKLVFKENNFSRIGDTNHQGDFKKIKAFFKWQPKITFEEGIMKIIDKKY
mgnify:CR=1 FL=1